MRFISTSIHGVLDYIGSLFLIISPWLFQFADGGSAQWVLVIVGVVILLMAVFTNFEAGFIKRIPMGTHLTVDIVLGIILMLSPWLFRFGDYVTEPHVAFGIYLIVLGLLTQRVPKVREVHVR